ncbi:MAG: transcription antitermination factor NusB [Phycisphaerales bacterium]|jgi:N utilization substance protein B|nr:transcription antitermination factor NusB [Phycisphaerales bacterium]
MSTPRDIRTAALQSLYQFDCSGDDQPELVLESLAEFGGTESSRQQGLDMAQRIWACRNEADEAVAALTPEWPTHRQPVLDRNILRLAWFELHHDDTPPKVAINEAVELAREFSTEQSPLFVNGVLDKLWRIQRDIPATNGTDA